MKDTYFLSRLGGLDINGNQVERSKSEYPYSYDFFVTHRFGENSEFNSMAYSDRLLQWDWDKFNECCRKVWNNHGQLFGDRKPKQIEQFLQIYYNNPKLKLVVIMEGCNVSSGYPIWAFFFNTGEE